MPTENTFLMVNLNDSKTKKIAQAIQSNTCKKILDLLAHGPKTETDISKELSMPISTAHYNLSLLVESKLVKADEYHYSRKGKEMLHYSLANKYVIITPGDASPSFLEKLKTIIPVGLIVIAVAYLAQLFTRGSFMASSFSDVSSSSKSAIAERVAAEAGEVISQKMAPYLAQEAEVAAFDEAINQTVPQLVDKVVYVNNNANLMLYFIAGAIFCLALYLLVEYIRNRKK